MPFFVLYWWDRKVFFGSFPAKPLSYTPGESHAIPIRSITVCFSTHPKNLECGMLSHKVSGHLRPLLRSNETLDIVAKAMELPTRRLEKSEVCAYLGRDFTSESIFCTNLLSKWVEYSFGSHSVCGIISGTLHKSSSHISFSYLLHSWRGVSVSVTFHWDARKRLREEKGAHSTASEDFMFIFSRCLMNLSA